MADDDQRGDRQKVLIAGAGVAGLEAALALRDLAGERVEVACPRPAPRVRLPAVCDRRAVRDHAGLSLRPAAAERALRRLAPASTIVAVEPSGGVAITADGERFPYDHLIVATGARTLWAVPGAVTYWGVADEGQVGDLIADLRSGRLRRLALTMPAGHSWAVPLYELALLARRPEGR